MDATDDNGFTALMYAAKAGASETCAVLLQRLDSGVYSRSTDGSTALQLAMRYNHAVVCELIMQRYAADGEVSRADCVFLMGCAAGHVECCAALLRHGVSVNAKNSVCKHILSVFRYCAQTGCTALHSAALNGHIETVKLLLEHEADTSTLDEVAAHILSLVSDLVPGWKKCG